ncbi:MAG: phosphoribosylaminoimidazolesuccinocarboxamide synthase [Theionarchaea archaeon]|nr:phosphoribosylaminoimidazolesuccinocarboxamide synthase [Theionarchaea archaeon]
MRLWKVGKVKKVFQVSHTELEFEFTDQISVFDKVIPTLVPRKGETLCRTSAYWFRRADTLGIKTHFKEVVAPNRMRVQRVEIRENPCADDANFLVPLEFIARYYVAGSLLDRVESGKVDPENLGLSSVHYGDELPEPLIEVTTKLEKVDRHIDRKEALRISGLSTDEYDDITETILRIDADINTQVKKRGLIHVDGKKEFALDEDRSIMVIDTYGTADEDRFWDLEAYEEGECIELSKEFVRSYYRESGYHEKLYAARAEKRSEPDIPHLPEEMVKKTSRLYIDLYRKITGEDIHES